MAHDLRRQHRLDQLAIGLPIGMRLAETVERGNRVIAQHHVAIEHTFHQHRLRRARADRFQHFRDLAPHLGGHRLVGQVIAQRADDAIAKPGQRRDDGFVQRWLGQPVDQIAD
jgi:hypothetical protein